MKPIKASISRAGICPRWGTEITVKGFYEYRSLSDAHAVLAAYSCPIVNNMMMPDWRKIQPFDQYPYCDMPETCPLLKQFPRKIAVTREVSPETMAACATNK